MKKYIIYTILAFMSATHFSSAQSLDASTVSEIVKKGNQPVIDAIKNQTKTLKDTILPTIVNTKPATVYPESKSIQNVISFLPVAFFVFIISSVFIKLRKDGVKLRDILIDKEITHEKIKSNTAIAVAAFNANKENPNNETPKTQEQSTSRLIAFICAMISIALACCIASFYFYQLFTGGKAEISGLTNVIYGLGLGVVPYGFNKITSSLK